MLADKFGFQMCSDTNRPLAAETEATLEVNRSSTVRTSTVINLK